MQNQITQSNQNQPIPLSQEIIQKNQQTLHLPQVDKDKIQDFLVKEYFQLCQEIDDIKTNKIVETLNLPSDFDTVKKSYRLRQGKGWRPLFESEIDEAQANTICATHAAKYLGVSYRVYRRWCLVYNKWKPRPWGKGIKRTWNPNTGKYPLNQILEGKFPDFPTKRLKNLLINSGIKEAKCEICQFNEKRVTDNKIPLIVNFKDGDDKNHKLENLQMLCYNHYFTMGRGYIRRGKVEFNFLDSEIDA